MSRMARVEFAFVVVLVLLSTTPAPAHAYLDPGTGALIVQAVLGAIIGVGVTAKIYWGRTKSFIGGVFDKFRKE